MDQFNLDTVSIMLLDVACSQGFRELMDAGHLCWILLVAPRIASVTFSSWLVNIAQIYQYAAIIIIKEHNSKHTNNKVGDGAALVGRMFIGTSEIAK